MKLLTKVMNRLYKKSMKLFKIKAHLNKLTIPNAKPPAMPEESQSFTISEDLLDMFDRSKHAKENFHDDNIKSFES